METARSARGGERRGGHTRRTIASTVAWLIVLSLACAPAPAPTVSPATGSWRAWLDSPGGALPFGLEIGRSASGWTAEILNGPERIEIPAVTVEDRRVEFAIPKYDSRIVATLGDDGRRLEGSWSKTSGPGKTAELTFHAAAGAAPRFDSAEDADVSMVVGRWAVDFDSSDDLAIGLFEPGAGASLTGTFLTTTGDYRYLEGTFSEGRLRLSCFDGAHAFLFDARLAEDGTLSGDFWSRDSWHETWTARRDPAAELPDPFAQTIWVDGADLASARYPDLDGNLRSLNDPAFGGRARLIEIFGSWCPNCNDATEHFVELDRRYRDRGLTIVGLAFEMTGEFERDAAQVRTYAEFHGIEFPLLIAGTADKAAASRSFPLIDRVRSYPTTIFLDAAGTVRAVYTGYSGPATGAAHERLRGDFERLIEELLGDEPAGGGAGA